MHYSCWRHVSSVTHIEHRATVRIILALVHVSFVSKGTRWRRTLKNRNNSIFYESNWSRFDLVQTYIQILRPTGKPRVTYEYCQCFCPDRKNVESHATAGWQSPKSLDESERVHGRVRTAAGLCFVLAAQASTVSLSASLGWGEEAQQRLEHNSDSYTALHRWLQLSFVFSVASIGCRGNLPIAMVVRLGLRQPWYFLRRHRRGSLCYDL